MADEHEELTDQVLGKPIDNKWDSIIEQKIAESKQRNAKKRGWVVLRKSWLTSSINYRMTLEEIAVFSKLIVMADEFGPVPGLISDNDFRAMPHDYLAHQACCPVEIFESTLKKAIEDDSIYENGHGIFVIHFDDYQFTEYDRQKPYRQARKDQQPIDPEKYTQGRYGHMVHTGSHNPRDLPKVYTPSPDYPDLKEGEQE